MSVVHSIVNYTTKAVHSIFFSWIKFFFIYAAHASVFIDACAVGKVFFHFEKKNSKLEMRVFLFSYRTCGDEIEYMEICFCGFQSLVCGYSIYTTRVDFIFRLCGFFIADTLNLCVCHLRMCVEWIILGINQLMWKLFTTSR